MALTFGTAPFGSRPGGRFNTDPTLPDPLLWFEHYPLRVRAVLAGEVVADSRRAKLLHSSGALPVFWFPMEDIAHDCLTRGERTEERHQQQPERPAHELPSIGPKKRGTLHLPG